VSIIIRMRRFCEEFPQIKYYMLIGVLDGVSSTMKLIAKPRISGDLIIILQETNTLFALLGTCLMFSRRFTYWQVWSVFLSFCGVIIVMLQIIKGKFVGETLFVIVMSIYPAVQATSFIIKEKLFLDNPDLDIFIVNSQNTIFQILAVPILCVIAYSMNAKFFPEGTTISSFFDFGFSCMIGQSNSVQSNCPWTPKLYPIYISVNFLFNIALLWLVKRSSALHAYLVLKAMLPVGLILFYFNWPLMEPVRFSIYSVIGLPIILVSIILYAFFTFQQENYSLKCFSFQIPALEQFLGENDSANHSEVVSERTQLVVNNKNEQ